MTKTTIDTIHRFEKAGLGKAPFRCTGISIRRWPIPISPGSSTMVGAPGQPMGTCAYCYTGIAECYHIVSADKKEFIVGCECVRHTEDAGLIRVASKAKKNLDIEKRSERIRAAGDYLESHASLLVSEPHPNAYMANKGSTLRDYAIWVLYNAGTAGKLKIVRLIEKHSSP